MTSGQPNWSLRVHDGGSCISLAGDWAVGAARSVPTVSAADNRLSFNTETLGTWDSSLLVFLAALRRSAAAHHVAFDPSGLPEPATRLLALLPEGEAHPAAIHAQPFWVARIGRAVLDFVAEIIELTALVGDSICRSGAAMTDRARMRSADLFTAMRNAGVGALPIVAVVNLLVGGILAFVGAVQLRRFGADIYVANLIGVAVVREMAALMTAIVMAGRTGGAYAAEIASMQGSGEIDALRVIGIPILDYLLLPRILALTAMMPLLYLYGSAIGIIGGFIVAIAMLHISAASFQAQLLSAVSGGQILFGFGKAIAFGALIAIVGCRIGLRAGRSAADVGHAATSAVVAGIVGVIALDAVFAVCANALNF
jgi:phospholipid/cholesterol/gamma-HCH transport system permease protein